MLYGINCKRSIFSKWEEKYIVTSSRPNGYFQFWGFAVIIVGVNFFLLTCFGPQLNGFAGESKRVRIVNIFDPI